MTSELNDVLIAIGPRLRALRKKNGVTLASLSASTGISISTLSRLESGARKPTLELLLPLAQAHRVPLDELVGSWETGDPRVHGKPVVVNGQTIVPLSHNPGGVQAFKHIMPGGTRTEPDRRTHEGYEWLYVLSGKLRICLGANDFILKAGEVAEFDTHVPHWFGNGDARTVEFLSLFGPQGERIHVRARTR